MDEDTVTIGQRLRRIRVARDKTQKVIADRAGISDAYLSLLESGKRPLDSLKLIKDLANALEIAPSELTAIPIPAPGNGHTDSAVEAVRLALDAVAVNSPGGLVLPVGVLRDRVTEILLKRRAGRFAEVATDLPVLIRDLHTTLGTGRDHGELLALAVQLHVHTTRMWLYQAAAPADLPRRVVFLARTLAREHSEPTTLGVAAFGVADVLLSGGAFELGRAELDSVTLPPTTAGTVGLMGQLQMLHGVAAVADGRLDDSAAPMDAAADMVERFGDTTGEADSLGFMLGPVEMGLSRMALALDAGEPDRAVSIAGDVHPERHPLPGYAAYYWSHYGRGLAQLPGRRDDAVRAFLRAEEIFPVRVYRDPFARDAIAGLVERSRRDAVGRDLRGLAWRADLRV